MEDSPGAAVLARPLVLSPPSVSDAPTVAEWCRGKGAAGLAAALAMFAGPATVLLAHIIAILAGQDEPAEIRVRAWSTVRRTATAAECAFLDCEAGTPVVKRRCTMRAGIGCLVPTDVLADVESTVITGLLPLGADLGDEAGLGVILGDLGWREPLGARVYMGGVAATARMWRGDKRAAAASEEIRPWVCELLDVPPPAAPAGLWKAFFSVQSC
jgi:hypothetical protein